jgi:plasmid stabilization system protein ParE
MFRIRVTARALADAEAAHAWMAENISPAFAERWYQGLFEQIDTLMHHPTRCPVAPESRRFAEEIRELTYCKKKRKNKYRILFSIDRETVTILYIHHSARKELEP